MKPFSLTEVTIAVPNELINSMKILPVEVKLNSSIGVFSIFREVSQTPYTINIHSIRNELHKTIKGSFEVYSVIGVFPSTGWTPDTANFSVELDKRNKENERLTSELEEARTNRESLETSIYDRFTNQGRESDTR